MEWLWSIYWILMLCSLVFGIIITIKKNKITGLLQTILSLVSPIWSFVFALKRDYLSNEFRTKELYFMYTKLMEGNIEAIVILILYVILIITFFYNLFLFKKQKY